MKKYLLLAFALGALVGGGATYFVMNKKIDEAIEKELAELEEWKANLKKRRFMEDDAVAAMSPDTEYSKPEVDNVIPLIDAKYKKDYTAYSEKDRVVSEKFVSRPKPYKITLEEFSDTYEHYEKRILHYYEGDGVLIDEQNVVDDPESLIGDCLDIINNDIESEDIFVRNDLIETDFEIEMIPDSWNLDDGGDEE